MVTWSMAVLITSVNQAGTEEKRSSKEKSGVKGEVEEISKWDRCCIGPRGDVWRI